MWGTGCPKNWTGQRCARGVRKGRAGIAASEPWRVRLCGWGRARVRRLRTSLPQALLHERKVEKGKSDTAGGTGERGLRRKNQLFHLRCDCGLAEGQCPATVLGFKRGVRPEGLDEGLVPII